MASRLPNGQFPWRTSRRTQRAGGGDNSPGAAASVLVHFALDGSVTVQLFGPAASELVRLDLNAAGSYSLLRVRGEIWQAAAFQVTRSHQPASLALAVRAARTVARGAVEARALALPSDGRRVERHLAIDPRGTWHSQYEDRRRSGRRIVGDARGGIGPDAITRLTRQQIEPNGAETWTLSAETRPAGRSNVSDPGLAGGARPAMVTESRVSYADGGTGTYRTLSYEENHGREQSGQGGWQGRPSVPGSHSSHQTTIGPDGTRTDSTVTAHDDGGWTVSTEKTGPLDPGSGSQHSESTWTHFDANHEKTSSHQETVTTVDRTSETTTWQKTTVGPDGEVTSERGVSVVDSHPGSQAGSTTVVTVNPDGSITVTTTTTDEDGNGTSHTTTVDGNGGVVSDNTTPVGSGGPQPPSDDDSSDDDNSEDEESEEDESDDDSSDDDSSDDDDSSEDNDDYEPDPDEIDATGDDEAMGWDGTDEGPPSIMPTRPADIWSIIADPIRDPDSESDNPVGVRIAELLKHGAAVIPAKVGDTGWGDATGSERPTEDVLTHGSALNTGRVPTPTEDWGDWNDPRVHVAYAARLLDALAHSAPTDALAANGSTALASITRSIRAVEHLGALISRVGSGR